MNPKELAAHYNVKVFDKPEAAEAAGFVLTQTMTPRNVWNKASAASAIIHDLLARKRRGYGLEALSSDVERRVREIFRGGKEVMPKDK